MIETVAPRTPQLPQMSVPLAMLIALLLPIKFLAVMGISSANLGVALAVSVCTIWLTSLRAYRLGAALQALIVASAISGLLLASLARPTHHVNTRTAVSMTLTIISLGVTFGAILWVRRHLGTQTIALLYGAGVIVNAALTPTLWSTNPFKYAFAWPITLILLALTYKSRRRWPTIAALAIIGALSVTNDYRGYFGFILITAVAFLWRWNREGVPTRARLIRGISVIVAAAYGVYRLAIWLALNGHLGERNQAVTGRQAISDQSVLTSSRPEWGGALNLFAHRPIGFGPGVVPNTSEVQVGKSGIKTLNASTSTDYVNGYLFDSRIELHSVISDLWVNFGLIGLALAVLLTLILVRRLAGLLASTSTPALPIMLCVIALWDLAFSPISSNLPTVIFTVALLLPLRLRANPAALRQRTKIPRALHV